MQLRSNILILIIKENLFQIAIQPSQEAVDFKQKQMLTGTYKFKTQKHFFMNLWTQNLLLVENQLFLEPEASGFQLVSVIQDF